jgi:hypothetical protein
LPVSIITDAEADRAISLRLSRSVPFSPDIALCDRDRCDGIYAKRLYYQAYGLAMHPLVRLMESCAMENAMAASISRSAPYEDRLAHYAAWLGAAQPVGVLDSRRSAPRRLGADEVGTVPSARTGV